MFKDILLPFVSEDIHEPAMRRACALVSASDGHLTAMVAVSFVAQAPPAWAYPPAGVFDSVEEAAVDAEQRLSKAVGQRLAGESIAHEIRVPGSRWLTPGEIAAFHAHHADLAVVGVAHPLPSIQRQLFGDLLIASGRPLLVVPDSDEGREFKHVVIAWKSSREAARAVHDALPLLRQASSVDVLMVERGDGKHGNGRSGAERLDACLIGHLDHHGIAANLVRRPRALGFTGEAILGHAAESRADLIVAGGYSRPRTLERVFGGVTRYLLEQSPVPVLFSH
jgi:nucleotide-binding universal stress UspA family protein